MRPMIAARVLAFVFFLSGAASLLYQVSWQRLLTLHYGVGAVAVALIVSVYMFGLGVGALLGGELAERTRDRLGLFCVVHLALALFGAFSMPLIDWLGRATAGAEYVIALPCMFALLSVPTVLMGVTLPLLIKVFTDMEVEFLSAVGFLYFVNTLGAAAGAVFASYVAISFFGLPGAVCSGVALNLVLVALIALVRRMPIAPGEGAAGSVPQSAECGEGLGRCAYALVAVTGFAAMGYETVWFRMIGVLVKDSPYAFSSVLAMYLLGVACGSYWVLRCLRRRPLVSRTRLYFLLQFLIGLCAATIVIVYYYLSRHTAFGMLTEFSFQADLHPSLAIFAGSAKRSWWIDLFLLTDVFLWPALFLLVPTLLMGAGFPLISSLALSRGGRQGATVGRVCFFNILGNVLGAFVTVFVLLPVIGTERTVACFAVAGLAFGLLIHRIGRINLRLPARLAVVVLLAVLLVALLPAQGGLYDIMHVPPPPFPGATRHFEEDVDAVVVTYERGDRIMNYINGQRHGSRPGPLFYGEAVEALSHVADPEHVLIVGCGAGNIVEAVLDCPEVEAVTLVELSEALVKNLRKVTSLRRLLDSERLNVIIDDGRRHLYRTDTVYDAILMDPLRTTTAGSNNLHSREFFELARSRLGPGGIVMVGGLHDYRVVARTLLSVFDHVQAYRNFCIASCAPFERDRTRQQQYLCRLTNAERARIAGVSMVLAGPEEVRDATEGSPENRDWFPVSEYYIGLALRDRFWENPADPHVR